MVTPDATLDDRRLHVYTIAAPSAESGREGTGLGHLQDVSTLARVALSLRRGEHVEPPGRHLPAHRAPRTWTPSPSQDVNADGELIGHTPDALRARPRGPARLRARASRPGTEPVISADRPSRSRLSRFGGRPLGRPRGGSPCANVLSSRSSSPPLLGVAALLLLWSALRGDRRPAAPAPRRARARLRGVSEPRARAPPRPTPPLETSGDAGRWQPSWCGWWPRAQPVAGARVRAYLRGRRTARASASWRRAGEGTTGEDGTLRLPAAPGLYLRQRPGRGPCPARREVRAAHGRGGDGGGAVAARRRARCGGARWPRAAASRCRWRR